MKNHYAPPGLSILLLMAGSFHQNALFTQRIYPAAHTDQKGSQAAQPEWKQFSSKEGGFSILLPGVPQENTETKDFPIVGKGVVHLFIIANESGFFLVGYVEVPGLAQSTREFSDGFGKGFLRSVGEGIAKGAGGKVLKDTDILLGSFPGKEILLEFPSGPATARAYFIRKRGYQLLAAPAASGGDPGAVKRFLDSFKLTTQ